MKLTNIKSKKSNKGMTLIELTVVILVLLSLISVLFIGARAWLRGSDRAAAAVLIRNAQNGVRSHSNIIGLDTPPVGGTPLPYTAAYTAELGVAPARALNFEIYGDGKFVENGTNADGAEPDHPANGNTFTTTAPDSIPPLTSLYMSSTLEPEFFTPSGIQ